MYNYIIVGAGSAGCVLAARLSADPAVSVLLLEAGPADDADEIRAPAALNRLFQTEYDWNYLTVPQHRAAGRSIYWPRGKVLGGSSSINAMIYIRGNRHDFQTWRDEHGCVGWGYEDLMPYFRRAEDNSRGACAYHGTGGPLARHRPPVQVTSLRGVHRGGQGAGRGGQRRLQRAAPGRRRLVPADPAPWPKVLGRHRLPVPRHIPAEPHRPHRRPGHQGDHRGRPGHRRELPAPRRARDRARRRRGHPVRRRDQQPSAADAVRRRPGRAPDRAWHRRGGGQPRSRREPQRPPGAAGRLVHAPGPRPVGEGRQREHAALAADSPRPADEQPGGVGRLRALRGRAARTGPAAACSARPVPEPGPGRPGPACDDGAGRPGRRGQPGADQAAQRRPQAPPRHRPRLPVRRPGQPGAGRGAEDGQGVRDGQADGRDLRAASWPRARTSAPTPNSWRTSGAAW